MDAMAPKSEPAELVPPVFAHGESRRADPLEKPAAVVGAHVVVLAEAKIHGHGVHAIVRALLV